MVGMTMVAASLGRVSDSLTSLCAAATLMTLHEPTILLDVGFQLSYSATLGLIVFCPRLFRMLRGCPTGSRIRQASRAWSRSPRCR